MSGHHNDDNHSMEQKPVSFTVPFILGCVTLLIIVLFLSLCDPKKHHGECACVENCSKECAEACAKDDHSLHPATKSGEAEAAKPEAVAADSSKTDSENSEAKEH